MWALPVKKAYLNSSINNCRGQLVPFEKCPSQQWRDAGVREGEGIVQPEWQHGLYYTQYLLSFIFIRQSSRSKLSAGLKSTRSLWNASLTCWDDHPLMGKQNLYHSMLPTAMDFSCKNMCVNLWFMWFPWFPWKNTFTAYFSNCK